MYAFVIDVVLDNFGVGFSLLLYKPMLIYCDLPVVHTYLLNLNIGFVFCFSFDVYLI